MPAKYSNYCQSIDPNLIMESSYNSTAYSIYFTLFNLLFSIYFSNIDESISELYLLAKQNNKFPLFSKLYILLHFFNIYYKLSNVLLFYYN